MTSKTGSGSMKRLQLKFQKRDAYQKGGNIYHTIVLKQVCTQCKKQIPAFILNIIQKTSEELDTVFRQGQKGLAVTQRKNVIVIHADKLRTFGKRYTLESDSDDTWISIAVIGSNKFHDLFIDIAQSGSVLMSYKGLVKQTPARKESVVGVQLSIVPSSEFDSAYAYCYQTACKEHLKRADSNTVKKLELKVSRLLLSPELYVTADNGRFRKITAKEFKSMFGAKLLKTPIVANKIYTQDLKNINDSYHRLRPYLGNNLGYDEGIRNGDLRYVSEKSLLAKIVDQFNAGKYHLPRIAIAKINDLVGNGLIAQEYIAPGTIVGEYSGEIVKMDPAATNENNNGVDNTYFAPYSLDAVPGSEMFVIDAKKGGNPTRFINHSDVNSNAAFVPVFDGKKFRLIVAATKPIEEGQQILLRYRPTYWLSCTVQKRIPL
jgi:hypothetical protein